jgi:hypothetical protein
MKVSFGLAAALLATASIANATIVDFSGTRQNVDAPGVAAARCGALTTTSVRNEPPTATSSGLSNFGAFTPTLSHCIQLPLSTSASTPFTLGQFDFDFGTGNSLFGSYDGSLSSTGPGLFAVVQTHNVTGGTGIFAGATGSFNSSGTLSFLTGRPVVQQSFAGLLNIPAVPEPRSWAMMIIGFGMVGSALRFRRGKLVVRDLLA